MLRQGCSVDIVKDGSISKCEGTTKGKVMQEYPEEMEYICKKDKVNQKGRIWENKYKTTVIELEEMKNRYKEMEKQKKDIERKYASIKEVYEQTKILSEQTKTKLKILHQEKETSEEVIKALESMTKAKMDSFPDKEWTDKTIINKFRKKEKTSGKDARKRLFKINRNKYDQSEPNHNTKRKRGRKSK